ncbi:hypothetical protein CEUSTIGMA_g8667.t1 [Chlamydomonas eustigma]|uniref:Nuclear/nucleolar GTPase 2 n=1 Tax=Chlamydomonas eustigma TaxID=1157962 RepID=A0A250XDS1_9CHLO|nr:hypothetical protein CEUSTIGMA_g8667.t1 [Chlamydomonas eustigma]|eukprot:GAX81235.1 hypothetical protein CEUSTIGMA_g8667.t1 [Chlamydomonas eustigma]
MAKRDASKKGKGGDSTADKRKPKHSGDANRPGKSTTGQRDASTVRRLAMYKTRAIRDKRGRILHEDLQSKELPSTRIQPDRRWFGNTRVIGQKQLDQFREEMSTKVNDAYTVLLREKKLPLQLLEDPEKKLGGKQLRSNLLATQPFKDVFGPNKKRKKPRLASESLAAFVETAEHKEDTFEEAAGPSDGTLRDAARDLALHKGQSKRIWGELYKVLDSSDVIIQVLDARDPMGTRCFHLERHIRKHLRHKHLILLLNKCDLVPSWVTKRWLHHLSREFPTLAFHASITNPFGKGALLSLLRQLSRLRADKQAISVGFVGYPNVGKSSVINTLRTKKVCKVAPVPGETKVWQYITLMKRIFLIDCPGVVYNKTTDSDTDIVLKGVVRIENLDDATEHVAKVLERVKPEYLRRAYKIKSWQDSEDFLTQVAKMSGKLLKGGDADLNIAARMVLLDWQKGKIPFFTLPPGHTEEKPSQPSTLEPAVADTAVLPLGGVEAGQLPEPAEAVTEEDATREAGANPEDAAAAARAVREALAAATRAQTKLAIPMQQNYFMPEDELREGEDLERGEEEVELVSSDEEDQEVLGKEEETEVSQGGEEEITDEEVENADPSGRSRNVGDGKRVGAKKRGLAVASKAKVAVDKDESDDDSAGYGPGGLSWEAVLSAVQGCEQESRPDSNHEKNQKEVNTKIAVDDKEKVKEGSKGKKRSRPVVRKETKETKASKLKTLE